MYIKMESFESVTADSLLILASRDHNQALFYCKWMMMTLVWRVALRHLLGIYCILKGVDKTFYILESKLQEASG